MCGSQLQDAIFENINTRLERRFVRAFNLVRPTRSLVLDEAPSPNQAAPARIVFQDLALLAEFEIAHNGKDIGPNLNEAAQQPSGRHLW